MAYLGLSPYPVGLPNTITGTMVVDTTITEADLADGSVTEGKIGTGAVTAGKLGAGSVVEAKIGDAAVTTAKLSDYNVTSSKLSNSITVAEQLTVSGNILSSGNVVADTFISTVATPSISTGAVTLDCGTASAFEISLSENITSLTISNVPTGAFGFIVQLNITGSYTVAWPNSIKWGDNTAPTLSTTSGRTDTFTFLTTDGGTTIYGIVSSQNALTA